MEDRDQNVSRRVRATICFAEFSVDLSSGELRRRGELLPLQQKPFQLLAALLERPGEVVSRHDLSEMLWGHDTFVDFNNNLNAAAKKLRDTLGDSPEAPRFIQTIPRRGYRFIHPLLSDSQSSQPHAAPAVRSGQENRSESHRSARSLGRLALRPALSALLLAALALGAYFAWDALSTAPKASVEKKTMLAVLPFRNLNEDEDGEYFADGLTEEMITHLGRLDPSRLGVIAPLSSMAYKHSSKSIGRIGQELGIDFALQASLRSQRNRTRIHVRLIQVGDGTQLWAETFEAGGDDILAVQQDIAVRTARALAIEIQPENEDFIARAGTTDTQAFEEYLKGRFHWRRFDRQGCLKAIEHYRRALESDPGFAQAWVGIADAYNILSFQGQDPATYLAEAKQAASTALRIDPASAEAFNSLAFAQLYLDWDVAASIRSFQRALSLRPGYAMAYHWQAGALAAAGRHREAIASMRRSLELNPIELSVISDLGWYYIYADRFDEAVKVCREALRRQPQHSWAESCLISAYDRQGMANQAWRLTRSRLLRSDPDRLRLKSVERPHPADSLEELRRTELERLLESDEEPYSREVAHLHALLGNRDEAFRWLEKAIAERDPWMVFLRCEPFFDGLHEDPRFLELLERVGLGSDS